MARSLHPDPALPRFRCKTSRSTLDRARSGQSAVRWHTARSCPIFSTARCVSTSPSACRSTRLGTPRLSRFAHCGQTLCSLLPVTWRKREVCTSINSACIAKLTNLPAEKGVTLSGGQKQRLSLARALYSRAHTLYIDDVLSALDATVSQHVASSLSKSWLLDGRRIVMVSHNVSLLLPIFEHVIRLDHGSITKTGSAKDLSAEVIAMEEHELEEELARVTSPRESKELSVQEKPESTAPSAGRRVYQEEKRQKGNVLFENYAFLMKSAGGLGYWILFFTIMLVARLSMLKQRYVLEEWTASGSLTNYFVNYYLIVSGVRILLTSIRWFVLYGNATAGFTVRAAAVMHAGMLEAILKAPLRYFDSMPAGRLLNRFSGDIQRLDGVMPESFGRSVMEALTFFTSLIVLGFSLPVS